LEIDATDFFALFEQVASQVLADEAGDAGDERAMLAGSGFWALGSGVIFGVGFWVLVGRVHFSGINEMALRIADSE
jgi:hypothetical protein